MSAAGAFYVQVFQYIDPAIAFGPAVSVEALVGAIVGGMGTLWGPVLGALALHALADLTQPVRRAARHQHGDLRRGADPDRDLRRAASAAAASRRRGCSAPRARWRNDMLQSTGAIHQLRRPEGRAGRQPGGASRQHQRAGRSQRRGQDHAVRAAVGLSAPGPGQGAVRRPGHHRHGAARRAPGHGAHLPDRAAVWRADGAREHRRGRAPAPGRADALAAAEAIARRVNLGAQLDKPAADRVRAQAPGAGARAGHPAQAAVAGRGAGGAEPGRDRRDDSRGAPAGGGWRDRADDRARDARGHEPGRAGLGAGAGPAHRQARRRR